MHRDDDRDEPLAELEGLPAEMTPPPHMEDRTVLALRARGLLTPSRSYRWLRTAAMVAAIAGAAAAGWLARGLPPSAQRQDSPRFMLLLYGAAQGYPSAEAAVREYGAWARELGAGGTRVSGEKLADGAVVIGAPIEAALVRGYFIVQAADERRALEIARTHPHVQRGGTIVVRRIDPT